MQILLSIARTAIASVFLCYSSWSDHKTREVSNTVWTVFAPCAFTLTFIEIYFYESSWQTMLLSYSLCFALTATISVALFYSGGFGGADSKALMCLALALPFYPRNLFTPLSGDISPISQTFFPLTVFSNSVLLAAGTAIFILLHNIFWHERTGKKLFEQDQGKESIWKKVLVMITGYKVPIATLKKKWHFYPLEDIEQSPAETSKRKLVVLPREEGRNATVERLDKAVEDGTIENSVWATPGLPMLIFITAGLIIAFFFGDIVWTCVRLLLR